jgi:hypothetical protein
MTFMLGSGSADGFSETDELPMRMRGTAHAHPAWLMSRKVAIGIWSVLAFVLAAVVINELLGEARPDSMFLGASFSAISAWLAYRLWRRPSRTIAIIAACAGTFLALLVITTIFEGGFGRFVAGVAIVGLILAGGLLPLRPYRWGRASEP